MTEVADALFAFLASWLGGAALTRMFPGRVSADLVAFMKDRLRRMMGRMVIVIGIVALGVGLFERSALAVTVGALTGWVVASLGELRRPA